ncbi:MAG: IS1634 family transposase [Acidimicrobiales bacterium]
MPATRSGPFELVSEKLGGLPILDHFLSEIGFDERLGRHLPKDDQRLRLSPGQVAGVLVRNIMVRHRPLYAIGEWAAPFAPALLGLSLGDAVHLNDDRVGRALDRLFDADRASLLTETVLAAVGAFGIDCNELHNDSTTVSFTGGAYEAAPRGAKKVPVVTYGHNKTFRPTLRQLVYVLTVSSDGAVPVALRIEDGNTNDDTTHVPTWDALRALFGHAGFLYVADAKLCSSAAMRHIDANGGRFVTVVPHGRREDRYFKDWIQTHAPTWQEALRLEGEREGDDERVWRTFEAPVPSSDGYRVIWVHSSDKAARDGAGRSAAIDKGLVAIEALEARITSPRARLRTLVAVEEAARGALKEAGALRWITVSVSEEKVQTYSQERRGRPGDKTRYRRHDKSVFHVRAELNADAIAYDARRDGLYPLITNDRVMTPAQVLAAYRYQPNLERRHHVLKGPQEVAPVFLETPHRIEALLTCHFFAQLVEALIEREIRAAMHAQGLRGIALYPELRNCPAPSAARVLEIFDDVERNYLMRDDEVVQVFEPELTELQLQVLDLLHVPHGAYLSSRSA